MDLQSRYGTGVSGFFKHIYYTGKCCKGYELDGSFLH